MVLFKQIVKPQLVRAEIIKNEDSDATLADYALFSNVILDRRYSQVFLKTIRFTIAYPHGGTHNAIGNIFHPYQIHLRWLDEDVGPYYQRGLIVQNTMVHSALGVLEVEQNMSVDRPAYSTFCHPESFASLEEPGNPASQFNHGHVNWLFYNMERNALIKQGSFTNLNFEIYFTNLRGQRYYRYIPNIEIEFDVY